MSVRHRLIPSSEGVCREAVDQCDEVMLDRLVDAVSTHLLSGTARSDVMQRYDLRKEVALVCTGMFFETDLTSIIKSMKAHENHWDFEED